MTDKEKSLVIDLMVRHLSEDDIINAFDMYEQSHTGLAVDRYFFHYTNAVRHGLSSRGDPVGGWLAGNCNFYALLLWVSVLCAVTVSPWFYVAVAVFLVFYFNACSGLAIHNRGGFFAIAGLALVTAPIFGVNAVVAKSGLMRLMR